MTASSFVEHLPRGAELSRAEGAWEGLTASAQSSGLRGHGSYGAEGGCVLGAGVREGAGERSGDVGEFDGCARLRGRAQAERPASVVVGPSRRMST